MKPDAQIDPMSRLAACNDVGCLKRRKYHFIARSLEYCRKRQPLSKAIASQNVFLYAMTTNNSAKYRASFAYQVWQAGDNHNYSTVLSYGAFRWQPHYPVQQSVISYSILAMSSRPWYPADSTCMRLSPSPVVDGTMDLLQFSDLRRSINQNRHEAISYQKNPFKHKVRSPNKIIRMMRQTLELSPLESFWHSATAKA